MLGQNRDKSRPGLLKGLLDTYQSETRGDGTDERSANAHPPSSRPEEATLPQEDAWYADTNKGRGSMSSLNP